MRPDLEKKLIDLTPYMFRYKGWDNMQQSLIGFGFDCGSGWFKLLEKLIVNIAKIDKKQTVKVFQVKEKYGTLRFYADNTTDEIDKLIRIAEQESEITCESCGELGTLRTDEWWRTLCDDCEKKRKNNDKQT